MTVQKLFRNPTVRISRKPLLGLISGDVVSITELSHTPLNGSKKSVLHQVLDIHHMDGHWPLVGNLPATRALSLLNFHRPE